MKEEYNLCEIPKEDIENFTEMMFALDSRADGSAAEMKILLSNYGKDIKEIQITIKKHLDSCFLCREYYQECLEKQKFEEEIVKTGLILNGEETEAKEFSKKRQNWETEHVVYESPEKLREYLFAKAISSVKNTSFDSNLKFEEHIEQCLSCKEVYGLELKLIGRKK